MLHLVPGEDSVPIMQVTVLGTKENFHNYGHSGVTTVSDGIGCIVYVPLICVIFLIDLTFIWY